MSEWEAIIVDLDGGERLDRCLRSIEAQTRKPSRVVIVDNDSTVPASLRIPGLQISHLIVRSERNLGFTGGVNLGWKKTSAPFVALINNDVELRPEWAETMMAELGGDDLLAGVQSIVLTPAGLIDGAGIDVESGRFLQLGHGQALESLRAEPWGISATAALYRRAALQEVSIDGAPFHPAFFAYYEDVELSARLRGSGWRLSLARRPLVMHEGSRTASILGSRADYLRTRNRYFVRRLHGVGRFGALLLEDGRKMLRALTRLEWKRLAAIASGVVAGGLKRI
ncbi:MAG: glycosyltransferase [Acidobacteria bacterium]|nr:glycosyltransferase [Acidobacteriota bacterium]